MCLCACVCVCMCFDVCVCIYMCVNTSMSSWSLSFFLSFSSFHLVSVILFSLHLLLYVLTPPRCEGPEGSVSRRGSGGFSPSLSPGDASTSC